MVGPLAELGAQVVEGGRSQERHRGRKLKLADLVHQRPRDAPVTDVGRIRARGHQQDVYAIPRQPVGDRVWIAQLDEIKEIRRL